MKPTMSAALRRIETWLNALPQWRDTGPPARRLIARLAAAGTRSRARTTRHTPPVNRPHEEAARGLFRAVPRAPHVPGGRRVPRR